MTTVNAGARAIHFAMRGIARAQQAAPLRRAKAGPCRGGRGPSLTQNKQATPLRTAKTHGLPGRVNAAELWWRRQSGVEFRSRGDRNPRSGPPHSKKATADPRRGGQARARRMGHPKGLTSVCVQTRKRDVSYSKAASSLPAAGRDVALRAGAPTNDNPPFAEGAKDGPPGRYGESAALAGAGGWVPFVPQGRRNDNVRARRRDSPRGEAKGADHADEVNNNENGFWRRLVFESPNGEFEDVVLLPKTGGAVMVGRDGGCRGGGTEIGERRHGKDIGERGRRKDLASEGAATI